MTRKRWRGERAKNGYSHNELHQRSHRTSGCSRGVSGMPGCLGLGTTSRLSVPFFDGNWANLDEFMLVMVVTPVASLTVPVAVVLMMPVFIIPVVIPMVIIVIPMVIIAIPLVIIGHGC